MKVESLMKMAGSYPDGLKTLWEKEKLLVTSNLSFSHSVFKRLVSQGRQKVSLCGNGLRRHFYLFSRTWRYLFNTLLVQLNSISNDQIFKGPNSKQLQTTNEIDVTEKSKSVMKG